MNRYLRTFEPCPSWMLEFMKRVRSLTSMTFPTKASICIERGVAHYLTLEYPDPRILQDVQRALKVKAKREAKMKATQTDSEHHHSPFAYVPSSSKQSKSPNGPPYPRLASPTPSPFSSSFRKASASTGSDVDFSPSTRRPPMQAPQHPVPSSLDNGLTLDWGSSALDEDKNDRRWSLSTRRKGKMPPLELMQDQQEKNYRERLSKLRASASSQTLRKAAMTSDQLQRRYSVFQDTQNNLVPLNLAAASRWYGSQDEMMRQEFEKAEPLTWLKHLPRRTQTLSRWHLSAWIIEEFVAAQSGYRQPQLPPQPHHMQPIPEDQSIQDLSRPLSREHSLERVYLLADKLRPPRDSFEVESRRSADSVLSSIVSGSSNPVTSPIPSVQQHSRPRAKTPSRPEYVGSGGEESTKSPVAANTSPEQHSRRTPLSPDSMNMRKKALTNLSDNIPKLVLPASDAEEGGQEPDKRLAPSPSLKSRSNIDLPVRSQRFMSSPLPRYPPMTEPQFEDPQEEIENEELLRGEYEQKAALLRDTQQHNQRIRQLLNRISTSVKEYDTVQRNAMSVLGKKQQILPKELVESFGHDPAAVTGVTRRLRGWRAVEDIHQRLVKQRQIFSAFITLESHRTTDHGSILDEKVSSLVQNLSVLEGRKEDLAKRTKEVQSLLQSVQKSYKDVKIDYDRAVPLTSALYPELSKAVALEESYKDQYQQIWEFGMDALTLLLDTVTPFWRNYGKTIGEDIRDFLIIPLYRNEFTGEAKRYPINALPRRSFHHWLGLGVVFLSSILWTFFQARVALSSTMHSKLRWIPFEGMRYTALPFFWVGILIQWSAVLVECGIVFMEMGVIAWWLGWSINLLT
ncbi:hypothetical protein D9756_006000 [Leucocoprinus leucothites]|uniref:Uncharacterized protein n=1 Tax=Leucocoprinus leucothites TaxID=201217 RepID=A0A8H5D409_9AGAR|nr:hypothetical protein D9756_006000 [Leucoagaricus leucothites]